MEDVGGREGKGEEENNVWGRENNEWGQEDNEWGQEDAWGQDDVWGQVKDVWDQEEEFVLEENLHNLNKKC
jgi:hypothetical protein